MKVELKDNTVIVMKQNNEQLSRALHGLTRSLIANMVTGVHTGFEKRLEVNGVGYRAKVTGNKLELTLGYSHPEFRHAVHQRIPIRIRSTQSGFSRE